MEYLSKAKEAAERFRTDIGPPRLLSASRDTTTTEHSDPAMPAGLSETASLNCSGSPSLIERYALLQQQYSALESRFNEVSLAGHTPQKSDSASLALSRSSPEVTELRSHLAQYEEEKQKVMLKMRELLDRYRSLQRAALELKQQHEEGQKRIHDLEAQILNKKAKSPCPSTPLSNSSQPSSSLPSPSPSQSDAGMQSRLQSDNDRLAGQLREVVSRYKKLQVTAKELANSKEATEERTSCLEEEVQQLRSRNEELKGRVSELEVTQADLMQALQAKQEGHALLDENARKVAKASKDERDMREEMEKQLTGLKALFEADRSDSTQQSSELQAELERQRQTVIALQKELTKLRDKTTSGSHGGAAPDNSVAAEQHRRKQDRAQVEVEKALQAKVDQLTTRLCEVQEAAQRDFSSLRAHNSQLEGELKNSQKERERIEGQVRKLLSDLHQLQGEREYWAAKSDQFRRQVEEVGSKSRDSKEQSAQQMGDLERELRGQAQLTQARRQLEAGQAVVKDMEGDLIRPRGQVQDRQMELLDIRKETNVMNTDLPVPQEQVRVLKPKMTRREEEEDRVWDDRAQAAEPEADRFQAIITGPEKQGAASEGGLATTSREPSAREGQMTDIIARSERSKKQAADSSSEAEERDRREGEVSFQVSKAEGKNKILNQQLEDSDTHLQQLSAELSQARAQMTISAARSEEEERQRENLCKQIEQDKDALKELTQQVEEKENQLSDMSAQLSVEKGRMDDIASQLQDRETQIRILFAQSQQQKKQLSLLSDQVEEEKRQQEKLLGERSDQDTQVTQLFNQLQEKDAHLRQTSTRMERQKGEIVELAKKFGEKEHECRELSEEVQEKAQTIAQLCKQLEGPEGQAADLSRQLEKGQGELGHGPTEISQRESQMAGLLTQLQDKETQVAQLRTQVQRQEAQISALSHATEQMEREGKGPDLSERSREMKSIHCRADLSTPAETIQELVTQLSGREAEVLSLFRQVQEQSEVLAELSGQVEVQHCRAQELSLLLQDRDERLSQVSAQLMDKKEQVTDKSTQVQGLCTQLSASDGQDTGVPAEPTATESPTNGIRVLEARVKELGMEIINLEEEAEEGRSMQAVLRGEVNRLERELTDVKQAESLAVEGRRDEVKQVRSLMEKGDEERRRVVEKLKEQLERSSREGKEMEERLARAEEMWLQLEGKWKEAMKVREEERRGREGAEKLLRELEGRVDALNAEMLAMQEGVPAMQEVLPALQEQTDQLQRKVGASVVEAHESRTRMAEVIGMFQAIQQRMHGLQGALEARDVRVGELEAELEEKRREEQRLQEQQMEAGRLGQGGAERVCELENLLAETELQLRNAQMEVGKLHESLGQVERRTDEEVEERSEREWAGRDESMVWQAKIAELEGQVRETEKEVQRMRAESERLTASSDQEIVRLRRELEEAQQKLQQKSMERVEMKDLRQRLQELEEQLMTTEGQRAKGLAELVKAQEDKQVVLEKLGILRSELEVGCREKEEVLHRLQLNEERLGATQEENAKVVERLKELVGRHRELQEKAREAVQRAKAGEQGALQMVEELRGEKGKLLEGQNRQQLQRLEGDVARLVEERNVGRAEIASLERERSILGEERDSLMQRVGRLEEELRGVVEDREESRQQGKRLQAETCLLDHELQSRGERVQVLEQKSKELGLEAEGLRERITRLDSERADVVEAERETRVCMVRRGKEAEELRIRLQESVKTLGRSEVKVKELEDELSQRTAAFDLYRARAHTALKKTASEQHGAEDRIKAVQIQLSEAEAKLSRAEQEKRRSQEESRAQLEDVEDRLQLTRAELLATESRLKSREEEMAAQLSARSQEVQALRKSAEQSLEENERHLHATLEGKDKEVQALQEEVEKGRREAKQRGDRARMLLEQKEKEIEEFKARLEHKQSQSATHAPFTSGRASKHGGITDEAPATAVHPEQKGSQSVILAEMAEEQILQLARLQAQRDEEVGRLRQHIGDTARQIQIRDAIISKLDEELRHNRLQVEELQRAADRGRELSGQGREANDRLTYLKNAVYRYLRAGSENMSEKKALVPVICTILKFTPQEIAEVQRTAQSSLSGTPGLLSSVLWGGHSRSATVSAVPRQHSSSSVTRTPPHLPSHRSGDLHPIPLEPDKNATLALSAAFTQPSAAFDLQDFRGVSGDNT